MAPEVVVVAAQGFCAPLFGADYRLGYMSVVVRSSCLETDSALSYLAHFAPFAAARRIVASRRHFSLRRVAR